jgi:hypothetical protein
MPLPRAFALLTLLLTAGLVGCSQSSSESTASPEIVEKTVALTPSSAPVQIGFLTGQLQGLEVVRRVEEGTGRIVEPAELHGTLKLKNTATDRAARVVGGRIEYADSQGNPIPLGEGRGEATISFYSYGGERLDPGMETSQNIEVPFPAAALRSGSLADLRVELTFIPSPYREETGSVKVSLTDAKQASATQ